jgi:clan AA aspartic protease (TIGR02281 family)
VRTTFPSLRQALLIGTALIAINGLLFGTPAHAAAPPSPTDEHTVTKQPEDMTGSCQPDSERARWGLCNPAQPSQLRQGNGVLHIDVIVNDKWTVDFVLDSGASDVTINLGLFNQLVKDGTITKTDMIGRQTYRTANGDVTARTFRLRSLQVGDKIVYDVQASIHEGNNEGLMLLGQSFLQKFKAWSIDNQSRTLVLQ